MSAGDRNMNSIPMLILVFFLLLAQTPADAAAVPCPTKNQPEYAVLIDAGSSGSRVSLWTWDRGELYCSNKDSLLNITAVRDASGKESGLKISPGLSSIEKDPSSASSYLEPLLSFAAANIPQDQHDRTPLYILATAGMRLLPEEKQQKIYDVLLRDIPKKYKFVVAKDHIVTISGQEEAMYAWITVNYLNHKLERTMEKNIVTTPIVEMGGASAQIAFEVKSDKELATIIQKSGASSIDDLRDFITDIDLGNGNRYTLYARSYLGAGADAARRAYLLNLVKEDAADPDILQVSLVDPCLPPLVKSDASFVNVANETVQVLMIGSGNFTACQKLLKSIVDISVPAKSCSLIHKKSKRDIIFPGRIRKIGVCPVKKLAESGVEFTTANQVDGLSVFMFALKDLIKTVGVFDYDKVQELVTQECAGAPLSVPRRKRDLAIEVHEPVSKLTCFRGAWALTFLTETAHMPKTFKHFTTLSQVDGKDVGWPLGALLFKTRTLPRQCPAKC